jgi:hypothetical protein
LPAPKRCHGGHISSAASISFTQQNLLDWADANIDWGNPPNVINLDFYIAGHASRQACQVYSAPPWRAGRWPGHRTGIRAARLHQRQWLRHRPGRELPLSQVFALAGGGCAPRKER